MAAKQTIKYTRTRKRKSPSPKKCPSSRNTLKDIPLVETFEALLNKSMISDEEKELMRLHYIQKKDFRFIGDTLGYSEASIKAKHRKILKKLNKLL